MSHPFQGHHIPGSVYHIHHGQHGLFHGHARTINTSDGSRTLFEHQTAGSSRGPVEKHQHTRQLDPKDKDRHPAHRGHTTPDTNTDVRPKPPKPGCPFHDRNPTDALRRAHAHSYHTFPGSKNGYKQRENSFIYHGNHPEARHHIVPPAPARQNQDHYHHAHDPAPAEPQLHELYRHLSFAHGVLDHEIPQHDPEESPHPKESPFIHHKPRVRIPEEELLWGYGPPLPVLTVRRRKNNERRRKT